MGELKTTRVQLELPPEAMSRIELIKRKTEATSYAEVTKNAYKILARLLEIVESGEALCVRGKNGALREIELLPMQSSRGTRRE